MTFESFLQDLRVGFRILVRRPAFSLMAALSLALGIGLVATQFSLIDGIMLRGLPISGAERLMHVARADPQQGGAFGWQSVAYRDYLALAERQTSFESLAAVNEMNLNLSGIRPDTLHPLRGAQQREPARRAGRAADARPLVHRR